MTFTFKFDRHAERPNIQLTAARDWIEFKSRVLSYSADADCRPVLTLEQELNADNAEDWANCDNKMVSFIKNRISSNIHMAMLRKLDSNASAQDIWKWLCDRYDRFDTNDDKTSLKNEIESTNLEEFESVEACSIHFEGLVTRYIAAGGKMSEEEVKLEFLRGVSLSMKTQADMLELMSPTLSFEEIVIRLQAAEKSKVNHQLRHRKSKEAEANLSEIRNFKRNMCFVCASHDHLARDCELRVGDGRWCLVCKKNTHFTNNCKHSEKAKKICRVMNAVLDDDEENYSVPEDMDAKMDSDLAKLFSTGIVVEDHEEEMWDRFLPSDDSFLDIYDEEK